MFHFDDSYIDLAFVNGNIVTVNHNDDIYDAIGIKKNRIVFVGTTTELEKWIDQSTKVIDLSGRSLLPGFIDTHYHPILKGFFGNTEDAAIINTGYDNCKSIIDILNLVRLAASKRKPGEWISMMGYDQNRIEELRHVTIEELDAAAPDHPVQCMRSCGHISIYNSKALQNIDVHKPEDAAKYPINEIVVLNHKLTGMVKDHTHFLLWSKVVYTEEQQTKAALKSNDLLLKNGIIVLDKNGKIKKKIFNWNHLCLDLPIYSFFSRYDQAD
jgi:predicted amidohydrolase YtcJ